jgi:hypothetical protein
MSNSCAIAHTSFDSLVDQYSDMLKGSVKEYGQCKEKAMQAT